MDPPPATGRSSPGPDAPPPGRGVRRSRRHPLGVAGSLCRFFITSPLSPLLLIASLAIGLLGLLYTPRQEDPQISVPMVDIFVSYPGASAEQVAKGATEPLERIMSEMPGVKHVYSISRRGSALVVVRFQVGEELESSLVKLYNKLESNWDRIPPGVGRPLVKPKSVDDVPIVTLTLWSASVDDMALRSLGYEVLQQLKGVPETGEGFLVGGRAAQIRVEVRPERLKGFDVSLEELAATITAANQEQKVGRIEVGGTSFTMYTGEFLERAEEIAQLVVGVRAGRPVYVGDVAEVRYLPEETQRLVEYFGGPSAPPALAEVSGSPAVTVAIAKKKGSNGVTVARAILEKVEGLKGGLIPDNVQVAVTRNYGETAQQKVNELLASLLGAAGFVSLLCWLYLGARPALVVITVIPVVILLTIWAAWVLGYTIDRVSLFALVFAIGILVDDATVVVENIFRRWLAEDTTRREVAVDAVSEVGNPTIVATLTVLAALLPMGFVSGMMGPYMRPIPVLGSVAMLFSLMAAFVFTPWVTMGLAPKLAALRRAELREERSREWLRRIYRPLILPFTTSPGRSWGLLVAILVAFTLSCVPFVTTDVTMKMLPLDDKPEFNVVVNLPEGTPLPDTANLTRRLVEQLRTLPEVSALQSYVGCASPFNFNGMVRHTYLRQQPWEADIQVQLRNKGARERSSHEIAVAARHLVTPVARAAGARVAVVEMPPGPPVLQTLVAEVYGPDPATRRRVAADLTGVLERVPGVVDVDNLVEEPTLTYRFQIDYEKANRRAISAAGINSTIAMAMGGYQLGDIKRGTTQEPTYIVLQVPVGVRSQIQRLGEIPVPDGEGRQVPLRELGEFVPALEEPVIYHKDLRPVEYVTGEMEGRLGAPLYGMLGVEGLVREQNESRGIGLTPHWVDPPVDDRHPAFQWTGEWTVTYETFRDLGLAFMAALLLIYILIVWEFGNFVLPLVVMAPIPLTLIGIVPGHWLLDAEFTATSMIGFIALAGILVRNSILIVDFAREMTVQGIPVVEAVVSACEIRFRPVVITDLTMMASAALLILDPIFQGMAISLLFGPLAATTLTFLVIPLGCISARKWLTAV